MRGWVNFDILFGSKKRRECHTRRKFHLFVSINDSLRSPLFPNHLYYWCNLFRTVTRKLTFAVFHLHISITCRNCHSSYTLNSPTILGYIYFSLLLSDSICPRCPSFDDCCNFDKLKWWKEFSRQGRRWCWSIVLSQICDVNPVESNKKCYQNHCSSIWAVSMRSIKG